MLREHYLFLTPSKTTGSVPSRNGARTTSNLTYSEEASMVRFL